MGIHNHAIARAPSGTHLCSNTSKVIAAVNEVSSLALVKNHEIDTADATGIAG